MAISPAGNAAVVETGINIERARRSKAVAAATAAAATTAATLFASPLIASARRRDMKLSVLSRSRLASPRARCLAPRGARGGDAATKFANFEIDIVGYEVPFTGRNLFPLYGLHACGGGGGGGGGAARTTKRTGVTSR